MNLFIELFKKEKNEAKGRGWKSERPSTQGSRLHRQADYRQVSDVGESKQTLEVKLFFPSEDESY